MKQHRHTSKKGWSPTYTSWHAMLQRCTNPNNCKFKMYGGRGIKVYPDWYDFRNFLAAMGERPDGKSLDRFPNRHENYEPGNCRWATSKEQIQNKDFKLRVRNKLGQFCGDL